MRVMMVTEGCRAGQARTMGAPQSRVHCPDGSCEREGETGAQKGCGAPGGAAHVRQRQEVEDARQRREAAAAAAGGAEAELLQRSRQRQGDTWRAQVHKPDQAPHPLKPLQVFGQAVYPAHASAPRLGAYGQQTCN